MDSQERHNPDLIRGKLLSDIGETALVYNGAFQGNPVVVKEARSPYIPIIQKEHDFLLAPPGMIEVKLSDYGIPTDWNIRTRFVRSIPAAVTPAMYARGITVLEKVDGKCLVDTKTELTNLKVPLKFHFGAIMGWVDMLKNLKRKDISMDSNIDTDLLLFPDTRTRTLNVVRIDCSPMLGGAKSMSVLQLPTSQFWLGANRSTGFLTQEQAAVIQVIDTMGGLYPRERPYSDFMGAAIAALEDKFQKGIINDSETLFDVLKSGIERAKWDDDYIKKGDNTRLTHWVGATFE